MANTADIKGDGLPDLDDLLQCPVCYEIPTGQIFQCNEGHHVCGRCKSRLDQCPVCRALFFGTRNYAMEELIANVRRLQAFKLGGKMTVTSTGTKREVSPENAEVSNSINGVVDEEATSDDFPSSTTLQAPPACKGLFRCLCCTESSERLPVARMLNHLRYFHSPHLLEGKSEGGEYLQAWQIPTEPGRIVTAVRVSDMGIFFLVIEINEDSIYAWVSMTTAPWVAHEFCYTITISGNDREAIFTDCVWSVRSCEGALKKRGRCLVVSGVDARALITGSQLNGRLALRRAAPGTAGSGAAPRAVLRVASRGTAPPASSADLEPFLQHLQDDVARLSRAFADLEVLTRIENGERVDEPTEVITTNTENAQMSRSARRRVRHRLRAILSAGEGPADRMAHNGQTAPAHGPASALTPAHARTSAAAHAPVPAHAPAPQTAGSSDGSTTNIQQRVNKKKRRYRR